MKQEGGGSGSTSGGQQGSHAAREVSAEEAAEAAEESMKEAGAGSMQPQVQGQVEEGQHQEEGEVSGHGSPEEHARRRAIEQVPAAACLYACAARSAGCGGSHRWHGRMPRDPARAVPSPLH